MAQDLSEILDKLQIEKPLIASDRKLEPLPDPVPLSDLLKDLKSAELIVDSHPEKPERGLAIYRAKGSELPHVLPEIGRLREKTFRTVGEGSGLAYDIDSFDLYYDQFFAFEKAKKEITGAYRIGRVDEILKLKGTVGVYTNTLFHLEKLLAADFKEGTLEAGRSFVQPQFQRGLTLLMIWSALAQFIAANPKYKYLMGPVSISNEFKENSKRLMVSYLMKNHPHEKSSMVAPKNPAEFESSLTPEELMSVVDQSLNLQGLQEFVRHAEGNPKAQVPQLIKLYLELGVRFLAFHKDKDFNSIDGLIWLDLREVPSAILSRYMTDAGYAKYMKYHS